MSSARKRLVALDLLRGLALLGIMVNHVFYFSVPLAATVLQDYHAIAFFLLSGIVFTYAAKEQALPNVVRGIVCIIMGLVLAAGNPPVDLILVNYGIMFLIAAGSVPKMKTRTLGLTGLVLLFASPIISQLVRGVTGTMRLEAPALGALEGVGNMMLRPLLYGNYPLLQWSAVFFLGTYIGRKLVAKPETSPLLLITGGTLAFLVSKGISLLFSLSSTDLFEMGRGNVPLGWQNLFVSYAYSGTTLGLAASTGVVLAVWGIIAWFERYASDSALHAVKWLGILGQATLSVYIIHVLIVLFVDIPKDGAWGLVYYLAQVVGFVVLTMLWRKSNLPSRGPFEAITQFIVKMEESKVRK